jgi:integrase
MTALRATSRLGSHPPDEHSAGADLFSWNWPAAPQTLALYDKYADKDFVLRLDEPTWVVFYKGEQSTLAFPPGELGQFQRQLVLLTHRNVSVSGLRHFAAILMAHWEFAVRLLEATPATLRREWEVCALNRERARAFKPLLKFVCQAEVGPWSKRLFPLVASLDTRANERVLQARRNIEARGKLAGAALQADIVRALDTASSTDDLSEQQLEGIVALGLIFQHGVRPVQVLCLRVEHAQFFTDAGGDLVCVVSFHAAKQDDGGEFEILRQVKPEWVPLIARLHASALLQGRTRLFATTSPTTLWSRAGLACKRFGVALKCNAQTLRHTGAQLLADAGHTRKSIQHFLGHVREATATAYIRASLPQAELINTALGASKLYKAVLSLADKTFVSVEQLQAASEDSQIGAVVGDRLVAGVGICKTGQSSCSYNPVTSCYGCPKFMPALDRPAHEEAVAGMREQVQVYLRRGVSEDNPAYRQLTRALSGAQEALAAIDRLQAGGA